MQSVFENGFRKRLQKSADYTINTSLSHVTSNSYGCISGDKLASVLSLTQDEIDMLMPQGVGGYTFVWQTIIDPDGKWITSYTNAYIRKKAPYRKVRYILPAKLRCKVRRVVI